MQNSHKPVARCNQLIVKDFYDEVLVYDLKTHQAHCLNQTAAFVWKCCNGKNAISDIGKKYEEMTRTFVSEDIIWLAIDQLAERDLLETSIAVTNKGQTRREAIKRIGLTAIVVLPIISSLTAPVAAQIGSPCSGAGCTCTLVANCTNPSGCLCSQQSTCPGNCTGGCSCVVPNGTNSCNSICA